MKLEQCVPGMAVFQKDYERIEGISVPKVGKKGTIKKVNRRSVRVQFVDGSYATFSEYAIAKEYLPFCYLRHISSEKAVLQGREFALQKVGVMLRIEVIKTFVGELQTTKWTEIEDTLTFLEKKITEVVGT